MHLRGAGTGIVARVARPGLESHRIDPSHEPQNLGEPHNPVDFVMANHLTSTWEF